MSASTILNAGIVVGCIEPAKGSDGLFNHGFHLGIVRYVAADSECFMALGGQFVRRGPRGLLIPVGQHHGSTRFSESFRGRKAESGAGAGNERDLVFKRNVHTEFLALCTGCAPACAPALSSPAEGSL